MKITATHYDCLPCGVIVTNLKCEITYCNTVFAQYLSADARGYENQHMNVFLTKGSKILFQQIVLPTVLHKNRIDEAQLNFVDSSHSKVPMVLFAKRERENDETIFWSCFPAIERNKLLVELNESKNQLEEANSQLKALYCTDSLTGCYTRREISLRLELIRRRSARQKESFGLLMLDLDHFKDVNDTHGHIEGDSILRQFGQLLRQKARLDDVIGRFGGEEFIILIPSTDMAGITASAERIHRTVRCIKSKASNVTVSIGVCLFSYDITATEQELIELADNALYESKRSGRNTTTLYSSSMMPLSPGVIEEVELK